MSLLEQDIIRKWQVDNKALPEPKKEFKARDDKEYEFEAIIDSIVYNQQANNSQMPSLYYFILWKSYPEEENTWELLLATIYLWKLINTFYKEYSKKPIMTSPLLNSAPLMARPIISKKPK